MADSVKSPVKHHYEPSDSVDKNVVVKPKQAFPSSFFTYKCE
eukprot:CAMPEP_0168330420 /NCGR_PEP_ID=MMETSP0213-20121227/7724_1 /TAXON_ID=151035 /ORGANISM="Euplotes harpa, Strain FSP1.4" /LENGTH=41 /DNA_ID= /DNA_START= /DNA_END= /DNA_ORIENTATION=